MAKTCGRRLFTVASVGGLAVGATFVAAGCIAGGPDPGADGGVTPPPSTTTTPVPPPRTTSTTRPAPPPSQPPPSPPAADAGPGTCPSDAPFVDANVEKEIGSSFKAPAAPSTSCSPSELTQLEMNLTSPNVKTFQDLGQGLGASCLACVITRSDAATWGPVVVLASDTTKGFANFGACYASIEGAACGKSFQYDQFCANQACSDCSESQEQACIGKVWGTGGVCKSVHDSVTASCPSLTQSVKTCGNTIVQHAKALCGGG